ncbi:MAG: T9SS type A sorting domain-containing protein [Saprospiraceae bacterium]|nr:T9SS type A sorting domain-containing protein [Saprospiraceae bacterium]
MKKTILLSVLMFPLFLFAQLSGTYTIGTSGNYSSFTAAVAALTSSGISGPVVFNIAQGTYNEQITIPAITGADSIKTITFQSANGDSSSVILTYAPTSSANNFTVKLVQSKYIIIKGITIQSTGTGAYGVVLKINGGSSNNKFVNNIVIGAATVSTSDELALVYNYRSSPIDSNKYISNCFINGSYAYFDDNSGNGSHGIEIVNNEFINQSHCCIYIRYHYQLAISENKFTNNNSAINSAINFFYLCDYIIEKNTIKMPYGASYGINGYQGNSNSSGIIRNNFISINATTSICKALGFGLPTRDLELYNNTVFIYGTNSSSIGLEYFCYSDSVFILNNIIVNNAGGYAISIDNSNNYFPYSIYSDYNNFTTNGNYLGYMATMGSVTNLAGWKYISNMDAHSVSIDPMFYTSTDLHVSNPLLNNLGIPLSNVFDDIDGEPRDTLSPDMGADEFSIHTKDIGATAIIHSLSGECFSANETIKVRIKNYGLSTINFSIDTAIINVNVSGAYPLTFNPVIISSDSLKPDSTMDVVISINYDMSGIGSYIFNASSSLSGDGNSINNAMPTQILTNYLVVNYPYSETIETFAIGNPGTFNHGWTSGNSTSYKWQVHSAATATSNTGPLVDHTTYSQLGKYVYTDAVNGNTANIAYFYSPCIDLDSLINPGLTFWYHMYGSGIGSLNVDIYNGSSWINNVYSLSGQQQSSISANWLQASMYLSSFTGTIKLRFRAVRGINQYGDIALDDIKIGEAPYVNLGPDTNICLGCSITLDAGAGTGLSYMWKKVPSHQIISTNQTITVNQAGIYHVIVTNQDGIGGTDSITITVSHPPTADAGTDSDICAGTTFSVIGDTATYFTNLLWTTSGTGTFSNDTSFSPIYSPSSADITNGSVYLKLTAFGILPYGNALDSLLLTINPLPIVNIVGLATSYCINAATVVITGSPSGGTFTGNRIAGSAFNPGSAGIGTHNIIYYCPPDINGCSSSDTQLVVVNSIPVVSFSGLPSNCCLNDSAFLLIGNPSGGSFSGLGILQNSFNPSNAGSGIHNIIYTFTDANSCTNSISQNITVNPNPIANAGLDKTIACGGAGVMIGSGSTSGFFYQWSPTNSLTSSTISNPIASPTITTIYTLTITNNTSGCTATDNVIVSITGGPTATAWPDTVICEGHNVTLYASGGTTYLWNTNATTPSITVSPTVTKEYTVTVTTGLCSDADTVTVVVNPLPLQPSIPAGPTELCLNSSNSYYSTVATYAASCQWFLKPANAGQIINNFNTASVDWNNTFHGNVQLSAFGVNLCGHGDTSNYLNIEIHELPNVDLGNDTIICKNQIITLDAGIGFASYHWSTGDTTQTISVDSLMGSGTYSVTVTDSFNCTNNDNITITFDPCSGFAELSQEAKIKIYPNPTNGIFTIEGENLKSIEIININGQIIKKIQDTHFDSAQCTVFKFEVDLSKQPKGIYFIRLWNDEFVRVGKVVLQ